MACRQGRHEKNSSLLRRLLTSGAGQGCIFGGGKNGVAKERRSKNGVAKMKGAKKDAEPGG